MWLLLLLLLAAGATPLKSPRASSLRRGWLFLINCTFVANFTRRHTLGRCGGRAENEGEYKSSPARTRPTSASPAWCSPSCSLKYRFEKSVAPMSHCPCAAGLEAGRGPWPHGWWRPYALLRPLENVSVLVELGFGVVRIKKERMRL